MRIDPNKLYAVMADKSSKDPIREVLGVNPGNGKLILWRDTSQAIGNIAHEDISHIVLGVEQPWSVRLSPAEAVSILGRMNVGQFVQQPVAPVSQQAKQLTLKGFVVQAEAGGYPTVLHSTRTQAEQEALRLAAANTGTNFFIQPIYAGSAVCKASVPKPVATLERL